MKKKASYCDECYNLEHPLDGKSEPKCSKGHKPRFYKPKSDCRYSSDWGYKRVCDDFEISTKVKRFKV